MNPPFQEGYAEVEWSRVFSILNHLKTSTHLQKETVVFYAVGDSFRTKKHIDSLPLKLPIELKRHDTSRKGFFWLVPLPMSRNFVIKILNPDCIIELFQELFDLLIVDFFIFNQRLEPDFLSEKMSLSQVFGKESVRQDEQHLIYGVNTEESETGAIEFVSYGSNTPEELTCVFNQ